MFQVDFNEKTNTIILIGNLEASKAEEVKMLLEKVEDTVIVDMSNLEFICSAGIGIMVMTYRKLKEKGKDIHLINLNDHIKKVFEVSMLDKVFNIK